MNPTPGPPAWPVYRRWLAAFTLLDALLVAAIVAVDAAVAIRPVAVLVLMLLGPGLAVTAFLDIKDALGELAVAIPISLACDALLAGLISVAGEWQPDVTLGWYSLAIAVLLAAHALRPPPARRNKQPSPS